jgi:putative intracellular protease/amidase
MKGLAWLVGPLAFLAAQGVVSDRAGADDDHPAVVLKGLDPVALIQGKEVAGVEAFAVRRGRFRYLFADAGNKAIFEASPARYEVQGGGRCVVMPRAPGSPDLFLVHEGRIYLFGSPGCRDRFKGDPAAFLATKRSNVAVFLYEGVELLDFAGPGEVFASAGQGRAFHVYTVAASPGPITSQGFVTVKPQYTIADCPRPDILILPGGATRVPLGDPGVIEWLRKSACDAEVVVSVCTGSFLLAKAGLLDGLEATTHGSSIELLKEAAPKATIREGRRFVDNGKVVTSAGVSAGIDASLHVVDRLLGRDAAREAARYMEYEWRPGGITESRR